MRARYGLWSALLASLWSVGVSAGEPGWTDMPATQWKGTTQAEVPALKRTAAAVIALPAREAKPLVVASADAQPPGLYEVRLTVRPSHAGDAVAFHGGLRIRTGGAVTSELPGESFARAHEPEYRTCRVVQPAAGPVTLTLEAFSDAAAADAARTRGRLKTGGPQLGENSVGSDMDLGLALTPERAVYYVVDKAEFRLLSRSGRVAAVALDKIVYKPGETMKGQVEVSDVGGKGGSGAVTLYLEHNVGDRTKARVLPVQLGPTPQTLSFEIPLPQEELGYALVAEYASTDGTDRNEAAEVFAVAANFQRVALFGATPGSTRDVAMEEEPIRKALTASRKEYYNACEYPFWAPDDLLEMTPETDWWFSGQANYHMNKQTLQRQIHLAHEQGIAMVTYGKWCVSGPQGWEAVYDRPQDFIGTYRQPIGSWDAHNTWVFDLRRNGEQVPYSPRPTGNGPWFDVWWNDFVGITPDASPAMIRSAAEETAASVDLFGWDAIRWDGHPRAGWNATGRSGQYQAWAARQTQSLVRYFKDVMAQKHASFRHGYNYFLIEKNKGYEWAKEDFELDELARDGGLLMNESIGNASAGWTFAEIANNLQVEGDLCRERGGFYLGISFAKSPRDRLIESALWAAAGCRPYNSGMTRETRRYLTRFAQYSLDERLRRLATPEKVLKPEAATALWWQPFVYETPLTNGRRQLVVNLLNLPLQDKRPARDGKDAPVWDMPAGTPPVAFGLDLPAGMKATGASLIDPLTLEVQALPLREGRFEVPAVAVWKVVVVEMSAEAGAPSLAERFGPPRTFGAKREALTESQRLPEVAIDPVREVWEVNKSMAPLQPDWIVAREAEQAALDAMGPADRIAALQKKRAEQTLDKLTNQWWKGGVLPDDLRFKDTVVNYGDLTPQRNGRMDVFYGRGPMDHRLRLPQVFAGLDRFDVHDAPFWGSFRGGGLGGMGLGGNVPWSRYPEFDVLLFTGIPYAAIGLENCYGMVPYVKAGGGVLFTGGEWGFGKGGYLMTVLERELLPVQCVALDDCRTSARPVAMEPGKDFAELACKADFSAKPCFWVYNQVLLKESPGVKVFVTSAKGPVLVGWQVGKGRVACLLVDYRGQSGRDATAFFDWRDWPGLAGAVLRWLSPQAGTVGPVRSSTTAEEARELTRRLEQDAMSDLGPGTPAMPSPASRGRGKPAEGASVTALRKLLAAPAEAVDSTVLMEQALSVAGLPDDVRWAVLDRVLARPPAALGERVKAGLSSADSALRSVALQCLGAVDAAALLREVKGAGAALQVDAGGRFYALTLAIPLVRTPELVDEGRHRVTQWNAAEKLVMDQWTGGKGFSPAAPELPCLDAESLFQRVAWLAYLSRHDPAAFGAQFIREWLMTGVYQDYCGRTVSNGQQRNLKSGDWVRLSAHWGRLRDLTRADVERLIKSNPQVAAEGLGRAHFTREVQAAVNVLGGEDRTATAAILARLRTAPNRDLAAFAAAREAR